MKPQITVVSEIVKGVQNIISHSDLPYMQIGVAGESSYSHILLADEIMPWDIGYKLVEDIAVKVSVPQSDAAILAESLVENDISTVFQHTSLAPRYLYPQNTEWIDST